MKRRSLLGLGLLILCLNGCMTGGGDADDASRCERSYDCDPGFVCAGGSCAPFSGCTAESCDGDAFCDAETMGCVSLEQKCASGGCACHIANMAGQYDVAGQPLLVVSAGARRRVDAMVAMVNGSALPTPRLPEFSLDDETFVRVVDGQLEGSDIPGETELTVLFGDVSCTAMVRNLGAMERSGNLRFAIYDDASGLPVEGAQLVIDGNGDGVDDLAAPLSDANGLVEVLVASGLTHADVTVFAPGYNYLSVVGLEVASSGDFALPLSRAATDAIAGVSGTFDWQPYRDRLWNGATQLVGAAFALSSISLDNLLNFDLASVIGPMGSCAEDDKWGCYSLGAGLFDGFELPLPTGLAAFFAGQSLKDTLDMVGAPGRRAALALGLEAGFETLGPVIGVASPYMNCSCDTTSDVCDAGCACDLDCGFEGLDVGKIVNAVYPLIPSLGVGVATNIPFEAMASEAWLERVKTPYAARSLDGMTVLDSGVEGGYSSLSFEEPLQNFTDFPVPDLPSAGSLARFDTMVVLSGVDAIGSGFLPLGLGLGFDCMGPNCLSGDTSGYDGRINPVRLCMPGQCLPGVPASSKTGHIGHFRAHTPASVAAHPPLTVAAALPLGSLLDGGLSLDVDGFHLTGWVLREEPTDGVSEQLRERAYLPLPQRQSTVAQRRYAVEANDAYDGHWVAFSSDDSVLERQLRWNVFYADGGRSFTAPAVPVGWDDPLAPAGAEAGVPEGHVSVSHFAYSLRDGQSVSSLVHQDGPRLSELVRWIDGFAAVMGPISAVEVGQ